MSKALVLAAVAYDPKVVTIWSGFRSWLRDRDCAIDVVLHGHYEHLVEDLVAGRIDVAWCSPLAWVRARRLTSAGPGPDLVPVVMRDTDRDLTSVVLVAAGSPVTRPVDLRGGTVAVGAMDSPQATLLPVSHLRAAGLGNGYLVVRGFEVGAGLHGDHIGGERDAVRALLDRRVDAACLLDATHLLLAEEGVLQPGTTRVLTQTEPFDHCIMVARGGADTEAVDRLRSCLLDMSFEDPEARRLLDLEGLTAWLPARTDRFAALEQAVDEARLYGPDGAVTDRAYRP